MKNHLQTIKKKNNTILHYDETFLVRCKKKYIQMVSENICLNISLSSEREKRTKKQTNTANKENKPSLTQEQKFCVTPRVSFVKTYDVSTQFRTPDLQLSHCGEHIHSVIHLQLLDCVMDGHKYSTQGGAVSIYNQ